MSAEIRGSTGAVSVARPLSRWSGLRRRFSGDAVLGYALITPALLYMAALLVYPLALSLYFSLSTATVADPVGTFAGLQNYFAAWDNEVFRLALRNSLVFTIGSAIVKGVLGTTLAFLLLRRFRGKRVLRGFLILPWTVPIALTTLGWQWMFDPQFSVINWVAVHTGLMHKGPNWLGTEPYAFIAVMMVNIWRGFPFTAIILLAALTSVPQEILEAARIDGAGFFTRYRRIIVPMIAPILFIGLIFDIVFTFGDLSVVYLLTRGGPINTTHILPTLAFQNGIQGGNLASGSAIALFMLPVLFVAVVTMLRLLKRRDT